MKLIDPLAHLAQYQTKLSLVAMLLKVDTVVHLILTHFNGCMVLAKVDLLHPDYMLKLL